MSARDITQIDDDREADNLGTCRFLIAMQEKLALKREEGRGGWNCPSECGLDDLKEMLEEHVPKGDPVDIANFAMMIWNREHPDGQPDPAKRPWPFPVGGAPAPLPTGMNVAAIAARQHDWVERMGWHNKTVLEALALIASEIGEAVNECRGEQPTPAFGSELVDIILRTLDLAVWQNVDIETEIASKMAINEARGTRGRRI